MDGPPAQSLGVEPVHGTIVKRPPRKSSDPVISVRLMRRVLTNGALIVVGTLWVFSLGMKEVWNSCWNAAVVPYIVHWLSYWCQRNLHEFCLDNKTITCIYLRQVAVTGYHDVLVLAGYPSWCWTWVEKGSFKLLICKRKTLVSISCANILLLITAFVTMAEMLWCVLSVGYQLWNTESHTPLPQWVVFLAPSNSKQIRYHRPTLAPIVFALGIQKCLSGLLQDGVLSRNAALTQRDTTMTFTTFVMFDMFNALCCRSADKIVPQMDMFANKAFVYSVGGSLFGQVRLPATMAFF